MGNALWLFLSLPQWFGDLFVAAFGPDQFVRTWGIFTVASMAAFLGGVLLSVLRDNPRPFTILWSFAFGLLFVAFAGFFRGHVQGTLEIFAIGAGTAVQALIVAWTIYRARGARLAAMLLTPLSISFWLFTMFVSAMSFQDNWL